MADNNVVYTNNTAEELYPNGQHFWSGTPLTAPGRVSPNSTALGQQRSTSEGALKFANVYLDGDKKYSTTRQIITAFDIATTQGYGPYGSELPKNYSLILGRDESIKEIIVRHGFIVDAIGFVIADKTGKTITKIFGGDGGDETRIPLQSDEYITQLSGTFGKYAHSNSDNVLAVLGIITNLNPDGYGPYGKLEHVQIHGNFSSASGPIIGFFGRSSNYLDSVGVYLTPDGVIQEFGPYGSQSPKNYSMKLGQDQSIKEISVWHGFIVDAIGFVVADKTGKNIITKFGGDKGKQDKISLKNDEYITHLSGTYGKYAHSNSSASIATLMIHTNLKPGGYGPYGRGEHIQNPTKFLSANGPIVGFFGTYNNYLDSVGVYLSISASSKVYAEIGPVGPIDWNEVEAKLGLSKPSTVSEGDVLGRIVEAVVYGSGDAGVLYGKT